MQALVSTLPDMRRTKPVEAVCVVCVCVFISSVAMSYIMFRFGLINSSNCDLPVLFSVAGIGSPTLVDSNGC